mmetsp:Transcript_89595/g.231241  ORF Transcript_89595/g.231241 Transcript_89595/m.231241 type:complete len:148 (-) Transcript_89595:131-574(-)
MACWLGSEEAWDAEAGNEDSSAELLHEDHHVPGRRDRAGRWKRAVAAGILLFTVVAAEALLAQTLNAITSKTTAREAEVAGALASKASTDWAELAKEEPFPSEMAVYKVAMANVSTAAAASPERLPSSAKSVSEAAAMLLTSADEVS